MIGAGETHSGACLCGSVTFTVAGPLGPAVACHCTQCRKQSGHFWVSTNVAESALTLSGGEHVRWHTASQHAARGFCGGCGSFLFWKRPDSGRIAISMGSFAAPTGTTIERHIFTVDKGDYYEIADGAPQFRGDD